MADRVRSIALITAGAGLALSMSAQAAPLFSGQNSSLTNVHLLAVDTEFFGPVDFGVWHVNDAPSGKLGGIDTDAGRDIEESGGLYAIAGINSDGGVSIMLPSGVARSSFWQDLFDTEAADVKQWLLNSDLGALENWFADEIYDANLATVFGRRGTLISFEAGDPVRVVTPPSDGTGGGPGGNVPAPATVGIMAVGALAVVRRRR